MHNTEKIKPQLISLQEKQLTRDLLRLCVYKGERGT